MRVWGFALYLSCLAPLTCAADPADSVADFSGTQGANGWSYGFYELGPVGGQPHGYSLSAFQLFDEFADGSQSWSASDALVAAENTQFLSLASDVGHPTGLGPAPQDSIVWAVRRYVVPTAGLARIDVDLRKQNVVNPLGGGITGRVFVDGTEIFSQLIENDDDVGVHTVLHNTVQIGSIIDFAIDPMGTTPLEGSDNIYSARADGSVFAATIEMVPEPAGWLLLVVGIATFAHRPTRWVATKQ